MVPCVPVKSMDRRLIMSCIPKYFGHSLANTEIYTNIDLSASMHFGMSQSSLISFYSHSSFIYWSSLLSHINIMRAMNMSKVSMMCKVSHVTITVLLSAYKMR